MKKLKGIVLRVNDLGESDKIVTLYSEQSGRIAGIAKGAKKSKKRFGNKLEIFSLLEILYDDRGRSGLVRIDEADLLNPFLSLRENYERYVGGGLASELVYSWSRDYDADPSVFNLLHWCLQRIDSDKPVRLTLVFFQVKLYSFLGYRLHLAACVQCGEAGKGGRPYVFHPARQGLICSNCNTQGSRGTVALSLSTVKLLQHSQDLPMEKLDRLRFSEASIDEALSLFKAYGQYLLQREIRAWGALEECRT